MLIAAVDKEKECVHITFDGENIIAMLIPDFFSGKLLIDYPDLAEIRIEAAHMNERKGQSLAQIWTREELFQLRANYPGVSFKLFPEDHTKKARGEFGFTDAADSVKAIWLFTQAHPEFSMRPWDGPKTEHKLALEAELTRQRRGITYDLNEDRYYGYKTEGCEHVLRILATARMSDNLLYWAGYRIGGKGKVYWKETFVMSVYRAVYMKDMTLRRDPKTGNPIGERWLWSLLKLHPYHRNGGTARSNLMHHRLRAAVKDFPDRRAALRSMGRAIAEFRHVLQDAGPYVPAVHADSGLPAPTLFDDADMRIAAS